MEKNIYSEMGEMKKEMGAMMDILKEIRSGT